VTEALIFSFMANHWIKERKIWDSER